ncbi:MAG TPA: glycosyltransferase [Kaistia sp.]|nr:glycosyltransferase [Kaistia sp.]
MHIALVNAFPTMASTAEVEYIRRFKRVAEAKGHHAYEVVTSEDIHCCAPDFVIATHEFTPKLTPFFTIGALWSPPAFYAEDPLRVRSILSYDGYLVGSSHVGQFLDDLEFSTGTHKPRSDFLFLPTAPETDFSPRRAEEPYELVYVGVHWDGKRHAGLLELLHASGDIAFYGPAANWRGYDGSFRGEVPYDGFSMQAVLAQHGIALCVHKDDHRLADTPSMRLFEAAAAGCLIITDEIPFARRVLGDSVFHLDLKRPAEINAARVRKIITWANTNPGAAEAMARRSHNILKREFGLSGTIDRCCDFVEAAKEQTRRIYRNGVALAAASAADGPLVDVVIRTGGRDTRQLETAIASIAAQSIGRYRIIVADYKRRADIRAIAARSNRPNLKVDYLPCSNTGRRSTTLWSGLKEVTAPYFALLDDDDAVMPDHFAHLLAAAAEHPDHPLYYSGTVRVDEDPVDFMAQPNFNGPMDIVVPEIRELKFMDRFDLVRLLNFDNYIQSNAWIARSSCLDERVLTDPNLIVAEDMYLYFMLARHGPFRLSPLPTAYWNWRTASSDNSMSAVEASIWRREGQRVLLRLNQEVMSDGHRFGSARALATMIPPANASDRLAMNRLKIGSQQSIGELVANFERANLHFNESSGIWTASTESNIRLRTEIPVTDLDVELVFMAAGSKRRTQAINLSINDQTLYHGTVRPWRLMKTRKRLDFETRTSVLTLRVECAYTTSPSVEGIGADLRQLGVFLSNIVCHPVAGLQPDLPAEAFEND